MTTKVSVFGLTLDELTAWMVEHGQPVYRARQIFQAIYHRPLTGFSDLKEIPQPLREQLAASFSFATINTLEHQLSVDGTQKWLLGLDDQQTIETVMIPAPVLKSRTGADKEETSSRRTVCASTQVGCAFGCAFCASGLKGLKRNLTTGEIVQQILLVEQGLGKERVSNIVFMGMGEPLANYDNLIKAIRIINSEQGLKIGARKITISTVGLVPMIERLAKEGLQLELAISLHASNDRLREQIMPVNRKYKMEELIAACRAYAGATKRMLTFEYILIDGLNDGIAQAKELAELLKGLLCKVNLIPCHPIPGTPWGRPPQLRMIAFERQLRNSGVQCTLRRSRGLDIDGACGQLRLRKEGSAGAPAEVK